MTARLMLPVLSMLCQYCTVVRGIEFFLDSTDVASCMGSTWNGIQRIAVPGVDLLN